MSSDNRKMVYITSNNPDESSDNRKMVYIPSNNPHESSDNKKMVHIPSSNNPDERIICGMSNDTYHGNKTHISTSILKSFVVNPASVKWAEEAKQDNSKLKVIDFGTDFHAFFLEPEFFKENYKILPACNRRKLEEKEAELVLIEEWIQKGYVSCKAEDFVKLEAMKASCMSHPTVKQIMGMEGILFESSFFWVDEESGVKCKCRPDIYAPVTDDNRPDFLKNRPEVKNLVVDLKTIGQFDNKERQSATLGYHIQDSFYSQGVSKVLKGDTCFIFMFVSTALSLGRYPVSCVEFDDVAKYEGSRKVSEGLASYASHHEEKKSWASVEVMSLPMWAIDDDDEESFI